MKRKALVLLLISAAFLASALCAFSCQRGPVPPTDGLNTLPTELELTTPTTTTTETTTTETTTETTSTETTTTEPEIVHYYSHVIVFLDIQRVVFFHTNARGEAVAEVSMRINSGAGSTPTPVPPPDKPFIISG